jgi:glucuronate isomerase
VVGRYLDEDFLLPTRTARDLYHGQAARLPIYDFHCHLPSRDIAENRAFGSPAEAWLAGDHYKWRAMRAAGVAERLITGDAPALEKFAAWAAVVPATLGSPLYDWTHLELSRCLGVKDRLLGPDTAAEIYHAAAAVLAGEDGRVRGLLARMNVRVVCTTDDPADTLEHHRRIAMEPGLPVTIVPTFRPDRALDLMDPGFPDWVERLGRAAGVEVRDLGSFLDAIQRRHGEFHALGCRASDHGLEQIPADDCTQSGARAAFLSAVRGARPDPGEARAFASFLLKELAGMDAAGGWVMQLHIGALRNVSSRGLSALGRDAGFDCISDQPVFHGLAAFLDGLEAAGRLPRTLLYCLDPSLNPHLSALAGCFPRDGEPGWVRVGPAWWFNDHRRGMEEQMRSLAETGLLSGFVGMTTDSRSFLSFPRHEYFRRVLCSMLGGMAEAGELPLDTGLLGKMVRDICWGNPSSFFAIPLKE